MGRAVIPIVPGVTAAWPKLIHHFVQNGYDWQETHFYTSTVTVDVALADGIVLSAARAGMLGKGCKLVRTTVSLEGTGSDIAEDTTVFPDNIFYPSGGFSEAANNPWMAMQIRLRADVAADAPTTLYKATSFLRGNKAAEMEIPIQRQFTGLMLNAWNAWKSVITGGKWGYLTFKREVATSPVKPISIWAQGE